MFRQRLVFVGFFAFIVICFFIIVFFLDGLLMSFVKVGETYDLEGGPYPASVLITSKDGPDVGTVRGDINITLPEGSKDITIDRLSVPYWIYSCPFTVKFTDIQNETQILIWRCGYANNTLVYPDKISFDVQ